ncbi:pyruvate kinase, partial [bacterium]|nr:pyruvate kinase [bacterium]
MSKEIWCTLGPASLNERVIGRLEELGVSLFRLNLSHTKVEDIRETLQKIQGWTEVPICLDTEGAQVRTGVFGSGEITVKENSTLRVSRDVVVGDVKRFSLYPDYIVNLLLVGDLLRLDGEVLAQVIAIEPDSVL